MWDLFTIFSLQNPNLIDASFWQTLHQIKRRVVSRWAFACVNSKLARDITWCQWFLMANLSACHPKKKALHDLGLFIHGFSQFGSKNQPNKTMDWWFVALLYTVKPVLHTPHIQAGTVAAVVTRRTVFTCLGLSCWCCSLRFPPCCALSPLAIPQYQSSSFTQWWMPAAGWVLWKEGAEHLFQNFPPNGECHTEDLCFLRSGLITRSLRMRTCAR